MRAKLLAVFGIGALACGGQGSWQRCDGDSDCSAGQVCRSPVAGERGVCVVALEIAITSPAAGSWVGQGGAPVAATARPATSAVSVPDALELRADGASAGTLQRQPDGTFGGRYQPLSTPNAPVSLTAVAALGALGEISSAPVAVGVDVDPPAVSNVTASCRGGATCLRNDVLDVSVTVTDAHLEAVALALDLGDAAPVPMSNGGSGDVYSASVDLKTLAFPAFSRAVGARLTASDAAGNPAASTGTVQVTRLMWTYSGGAPTTTPALTADGTAVIGLSAFSDQLRAVRLDGTERWRLKVGGNSITAAPSIGPSAIWVGSEDNHIYAVSLDGTAVLNGCDTGGGVKGTPALDGRTPEIAFAGSGSGRIYAAGTGSTCVMSPLTDAFAASAAVDRAGAILAATATATATATLRKYQFDGAFIPDWNAQVGVSVSAPVAIDASGNGWTGSQDARLNRTTPAGETTTVTTLGGSIVDSAVILAGGHVVVGDQNRVLHRFAPDGTSVWTKEPVLEGAVLAPLVLAGGDAMFIVPTAAGTVHAVDQNGKEIWSGKLSQGQALREGNVHTPPGSAVSIAYFGCADGNLYAVLVDGALDATAPWPKSHHDVRNTGNAASPLP